MSITQIMPSITVAEFVRKFGYNPDIGVAATAVDITPYGNDYLPSSVVAAEDIDITSASGDDDNDTPAGGGTGARTIVIEGLDSDYKLQSETIALNGTADVNPTLDYIRIHRAYVATAGTGAVNAGNITIDVGGSNTMAQILANRGQTLQAVYTIPANYAGAYLCGFDASVLNKAAAYVNFAIEVRSFGGAWQTKEFVGVSADSPYVKSFMFPSYLAAKADIRLRAIDASGNNLLAAGGFELMLV
jgi:hypothetical protein